MLCTPSSKRYRLSFGLNSYNALNEDKLKVEYDLNSKLEGTVSKLNEVKMDFDNLEQDFSQKIAQNKTLFKEMKDLEAEVEAKNLSLDELDETVAREQAKFRRLQAEKEALEENVRELKDLKAKNEDKIEKLFDDNQKLQDNCAELDKALDSAENEKMKLAGRIDEQNLELKNLSSKARGTAEELINEQKERENAQRGVSRLSQANKELESTVDDLKKQLNDLKIVLSREVREREESVKLNENYELTVLDKEKELKRICSDLELLRDRNDKLVEDNTALMNETERLRSHIVLVSEHNTKMEGELNAIVEQDERIRASLARKDRVNHLLAQNKSQLDKSINNLEDNYSKGGRGSSPYSRTRYEN